MPRKKSDWIIISWRPDFFHDYSPYRIPEPEILEDEAEASIGRVGSTKKEVIRNLRKVLNIVRRMTVPRPRDGFVGWKLTSKVKGYAGPLLVPQPHIYIDGWDANDDGAVFTKKKVIELLQKVIEEVKKMKVPSQRALAGLPRVGEYIWVVKNYGDHVTHLGHRFKIFKVVVTEHAINENGSVLVVHGLYEATRHEWFRTVRGARGYKHRLIEQERTKRRNVKIKQNKSRARGITS